MMNKMSNCKGGIPTKGIVLFKFNMQISKVTRKNVCNVFLINIMGALLQDLDVGQLQL